MRKIKPSELALVLGWISLLGSTACTTFRPCTQGGNLTGLPAIKGDRQCYQKKDKTGNYVNHGQFVQWHPNGQVAIQGAFRDGEKHGRWFYYDEKGKKTAEKYFEKDVEQSVLPQTPQN